MKRKSVRRFVIVGGSISALVAAAKLSERYPDAVITIINRGRFETYGGDGTDRFWHTFNLSALGLQMHYELCPESQHRLDLAGAPTLEWGKNTGVWFKNGWMTQNHLLGVTTRSMSRDLLAAELLYSLKSKIANGQIELVERVDVTGLVMSEGKAIGVKMVPRSGAKVPDWFYNSAGEEVRANFDEIILAVGKDAPWQEWFKDAGLEVSKFEEVDPHLTYSSADFTGIKMAKAMQFFATGDRDYEAMVISQIEGEDRWRVTLTVNYIEKNFGVKPPKNAQEFIALAQLISPIGAAYLRTGKISSQVRSYMNCQSRMQKVWDVVTWLDNVFVIGDALMSLNPKYGQGGTLAYLEAQLLVNMFEQGARSFNLEVKKLLAFSWTLATSADVGIRVHFEAPGVVKQTFADKLGGMFFTFMIHHAGGKNPEIAAAFFGVSNYVKLPKALFAPPVLKAAESAWVTYKLLRHEYPDAAVEAEKIAQLSYN